MAERIFLLSPANAAGLRMQMLLSPRARFDLAARLREGRATLGEAFEFASSLYFRGKRAYARKFARPPAGTPGVLVIAPGSGFLPEDQPMTAERLAALGAVPVDLRDPRYLLPFEQAARRLASELPAAAEVVLLGSIATDKYIGPLAGVFGRRLLFPPAFAGRGDMSRGGLLLRCVRADEELEYAPVLDGVRHGPRPQKLPRPPRSGAH